MISQTNEADQNNLHVRKVFGESRIGQTIHVPAGYISGIEVKINKKVLPDNTPIRLSIKKTSNDSLVLRQIDSTLGNAQRDDKLVFSFKPISRKNIYFELSAPTLNEKDCVALQYQIDSQKYPEGQIFQKNQPSYGDLAFTAYSSPPLYGLIYIYLRQFPPLALALALLIIAPFFWLFGKKPAETEQISLKKMLLPELKPVFLVFTVIFIIFLPTLTLYFRQDDFVLLERARVLLKNNPALLFTDRGFVEPTHSDFKSQIAFYRPITNSIIPAMLYQLAKLTAWPHYLFNNLIHAFNGALVYLLFRFFLKRRLSIVLSIFWATHAAIWITVAWLSSIQEVLATTFILATLLSIGAYWKNRRNNYLIWSLVFFTFALLSKENSFILLALIPLFCFAIDDKLSFLFFVRRQMRVLAPFLAVAAIILTIHTAMLNDPGMQTAYLDPSYKTSFNPAVMAGNLKTSLAFSFRGIFTVIPASQKISNYYEQATSLKGWSLNLPPYLLFLISAVFLLLIITLIKRPKHATFSVGLYILMSIPFLILLNERQERWLYFPLIGLVLTFGIFFQSLLPKINIPNRFKQIAVIILIFFAGAQSFIFINRHPDLLLARQQSALTMSALTLISANHSTVPANSRFYFLNFPKDKQQNLGFAAINLLYRDASIRVAYTDIIPKDIDEKTYLFKYMPENNKIIEISNPANKKE
ncbi:MAG: glycosyltransferase family 39 protein [bacterium]|nr:glycosyltransferase family 39 protein [bacterium]